MSIRTIDSDEALPADYRGGAVAIGNFDGVHRGHAALLAELRRQADAVGGPAVVLTFDPHPLKLLRPEQFLPVLTPTPERAELLQGQGVDHVLILRTTLEVLTRSAAEFFQHVVVDQLGSRSVVEGVDFGFGRNREGNVETLAALCRSTGIGLTIVPPLVRDGVKVSSSRIRNDLLRGDVRGADDLLGRPYRLRGRVGTGQRRGRVLGFPTANLVQTTSLIPAEGVYAVRAYWQNQAWPAAANIGPNPTFGEDARKVEVHLIGFKGNLYGESLAVDFLDRLRDTQKFAGVEALVEQLRLDVERAARLAQQDPGERTSRHVPTP
jgi:riboflavin kinase/FMN adenylyltransferase